MENMYRFTNYRMLISLTNFHLETMLVLLLKKAIELSKCDILRDLKFDYHSTDEFNKFSSNVRNSMELTVIHLSICSLNENCMELLKTKCFKTYFLQLINLDFDLFNCIVRDMVM